MKIEKTKGLKIKLKGEDADHFKKAIEKVVSQSKQIGFNQKLLDDKESKVIQDIHDKMKSF